MERAASEELLNGKLADYPRYAPEAAFRLLPGGGQQGCFKARSRLPYCHSFYYRHSRVSGNPERYCLIPPRSWQTTAGFPLTRE